MQIEIESSSLEAINTPDDNSIWMVWNWGEIRQTGDGSYEIEIYFIELKAYVESSPYPDYSIVKGTPQVSWHSISNIDLFHIGSIWKNKRLIKNLIDFRVQKSLKLLNVETNTRQTLGRFLPNETEAFIVPEALHDLPVRVFRREENFSKDSEFDFIILPCNAICDYFYFNSPQLTHFTIGNGLGPGINKVFDSNRSHVTIENGIRNAVIWLEKDMEDRDAFQIAQMAFDEYYLMRAREVYALLVNKEAGQEKKYLDCNIPIVDAVNFGVRGRSYKTRANEFKVYYIYSINYCSLKPPFDDLKVGRDNDGRTAERTNETKYLRQLVQKESQDTLKNPRLREEPSNRNIDEVSVRVKKDKNFAFDLDSVKKIEKLTQKYTGSIPITEEANSDNLKVSTNVESRSQGEIARGRVKIASPNIRFDDVFKQLFEIQREFKELYPNKKITYTYRSPIPYKGDDYNTFSIFPLSGLNDEIYRWCHLEENNPKRIRVVEVNCDGSVFYLMEIERKYANGNPLGLLRGKPSVAISNEDFAILLLDVAKKKGSWKQIQTTYDNKYIIVPMNHTKVASMARGILKKLKIPA